MNRISGEEGRAQAKREQILEAAQRVFLREGFAATSTDILAHEAGVSKRTLYAYYPSKEELFIAVVRQLTLENPQTQVLDFAQKQAPRSQEELREALLTLAHKILATTMQPEYIALLRTIIADAHRFPQLTDTLRSTVPERVAREVSQMLDVARANGIAIQAGDTEVMSRFFIGPLMSYPMFDGLLRPQGKPQLPTADKVETIVKLFLNAIVEHYSFERNHI